MQIQGKNTHRINCIQIRDCILTVTNTIKDFAGNKQPASML